MLDGAVMRSNMPRRFCSSDTAALTTQVMTSVALPLMQGDLVTNLTFISGGTAASVPTNWWFALYDTAAAPAKLAQTADQTTTAWAANTAKTVALSAPYVVPASGVYYASIMMKATTPISLAGVTLENAAVATGLTSTQFKLSVTSGSSLVATAPATIVTGGTAIAAVPIVSAS